MRLFIGKDQIGFISALQKVDTREYLTKRKLIRLCGCFFENPSLFIYVVHKLRRDGHSILEILAYTHLFMRRRENTYMTGFSRFTIAEIMIANQRNRKLYFNDLDTITCLEEYTSSKKRIAIQFREAEAWCQHEGHFSFTVSLDADKVIELSLIILDSCRMEPEFTILITRIQGVHMEYDNMKLISKHYRDLNVSEIALSAVEGLAILFNAKLIAVPAALHPSNKGQVNFQTAYDRLFYKFNATKRADGLFEFEVPFTINSSSYTCRTSHSARHKHHILTRRQISENTLNSIRLGLADPLYHFTPK